MQLLSIKNDSPVLENQEKLDSHAINKIYFYNKYIVHKISDSYTIQIYGCMCCKHKKIRNISFSIFDTF